MILETSTNDEYGRVLSEFVACGNAKRLDSDDVLCRQLLIARLTVQTFFSYGILTARSLRAQDEVACSASLLVLRARFAVLDSSRLPAGMKTFFAVSKPWSLRCSRAALKIFVVGDCD